MGRHRSFSVLGNVALVNFPDGFGRREKVEFAKEIFSKNKAVRTVLEKVGNFKGRLRRQETRWIAGERTKDVVYKENGCVFRFNIDETYFSSRLANERNEVCGFVEEGDRVLVMFAGVGPFPIVIAKKTGAREVYLNELNRKACEFARENVLKNKVGGKVKFACGDIKRVALKLKEEGEKFDFIVMARPNLKETFLEEALMLIESGGRIYYHGFSRVEDIDLMEKELVEEIGGRGWRVRVLNKKIIGDIAPGKARVRFVFEVGRGWLYRVKRWSRRIF